MASSHPDKPYPVLISSEEVFKGRVISLRLDQIKVAPELDVRREVISHPGAVVIVPVDAEGRILWVRQHRWAAQRELLELPAGTLEPGEEPEATARREIVEEVGVAAAEWRRLGGFYSAPGFCSEYLHCFLATGLHEEYAPGDEDEDIEVVPLTLDESLVLIDDGKIEDAKSLSGMMLYLRTLRS